MNGTWKSFAAAGITVAIAAVPGIYAYGQLDRDVAHSVEAILVGDARNATAIGKNEAAIAVNRERATRLENDTGRMSEQIGALRRDVGELKGVMGKVENGIAQMLSEIRKRK